MNPYLTFIGKARAAMEFYSSVFGGELTLQALTEANAAKSPEQENLIMHAQSGHTRRHDPDGLG